MVFAPVAPRPTALPPGGKPVQFAIDDVDVPVEHVTFCVVDLETTGGVAADLGITEIGAVKVRGGEVLGEFQTLVNPGTPIPAFISVLTGITDETVAGAPRLSAALPAFLEFSRNCVIVAHNAPYDTGYLRAACTAFDLEWNPVAVLDTAKLSRRTLGRDEVPNHKLATLARHFRADSPPTHRALEDARATVDVLHGLLERLGSLGVTGLNETLQFSSRVTPAQRRKRHLADGLPHAPGVYVFTDAQGRALYVGTSKDIRTRVRTYFTAAEQRSRMAEMVAVAESVTPIVCATPLEAAVRELRLIAEASPPYNRRSRNPERARWLKLTAEHAPRLSIASTVRDDTQRGAVYLGPLPTGLARTVAENLAALTGLRTCTERVAATSERAPCALLDLGRCSAPCRGGELPDEYVLAVGRTSDAMTGHTENLTESALRRIRALSDGQRYEEAASALRDLDATLRAVDAHQRRRTLADLGSVVAAARSGDGWDIHVIRHGRLAGAAHAGAQDDPRAVAAAAVACAEYVERPAPPHAAALTAETDLLLTWLAEHEARFVAMDADAVGAWALPLQSAARDRHRIVGGHPPTRAASTAGQSRADSRPDNATQRSKTLRAAPDATDSAATGRARRTRPTSGDSTGP